MPRFRHKRHNRVRVVPDARAESFRTSPHWLEIDESGSDSAVSASPPPEGEGTDLTVPEGNVGVVLEWAGDDPDRRAAALYAERQGKRRKTLLKALED